MWRLLLSCVSLVAAQNASIFSFSGNLTSSSPTMTTITISKSTGDCSTYSPGNYYTTMSAWFPTSGFRTVIGSGFDFLGFMPGTGGTLNTTNPCNSTPPLFPLVKSSLSNNQIAFGHYFPAGNYTFVLASSYPYPFVGEVWEGMFNGDTTGKNATWNPLEASSGSTCSVDSSTYPYDAQRIMVPITGTYTVTLAYGQNTGAAVQDQVPDGYTYLTVLAGDYTMANLSTLDCTAAGADFVAGYYSYGSSDIVVQLPSVMLTAGKNYTFVATAAPTYGSNVFFGRYSIVVAPQVYIPFGPIKAFNKPSSCDGTTAGCTTPNPIANQEYAYTEFVVPQHSWFYLLGRQVGLTGNSVYLSYYIYSEDNSVLAPCGTYGGSTCMTRDNYLSGVVFYSGSSSNFSVIATGYYSSQGTDGVLALQMLRGPALPAFSTTSAPTPATTTSAPTTSAPSTAGQTSAPTTSAPSTAGQTSAPTTRMPTVAGQTSAPTTRMPTVAGQTYAPTPATTTSAPTDMAKVSMSPFHGPCAAALLALALAL